MATSLQKQLKKQNLNSVRDLFGLSNPETMSETVSDHFSNINPVADRNENPRYINPFHNIKNIQDMQDRQERQERQEYCEYRDSDGDEYDEEGSYRTANFINGYENSNEGSEDNVNDETSISSMEEP